MKAVLAISRYRPNFNDPRVRRRAMQVLEWVQEYRSIKRPRWIHHREIQAVFGNYRRKGLAQWLVSNLLRQSGTYVPGVNPFSYEIDESGIEKITSMLGARKVTQAESLTRRFGGLIEGEQPITYTLRSERYWHPIQNIRRELRPSLFKGWYDYDIEAAAPTLVRQYAMKVIGERPSLARLVGDFPAVHELVTKKSEIRARIARVAGISEAEAKDLLHAIFFQASPAPSPKVALFRAVGQSRSRHRDLLNDAFIVRLRRESREMWAWALNRDRYERAILALQEGRASLAPRKKARHRQLLYQSLERKVLDAMVSFLDSRGVRHVRMHDGFMANQIVDVAELERAVFNKTGYKVKINERGGNAEGARGRVSAARSDRDADGGIMVYTSASASTPAADVEMAPVLDGLSPAHSD